MIQLEEKLYTSTEVADILGVSLRSVYRYLEEGKINAEVKTATGRHRFSKKNILDFLYPNGSTSTDTHTRPQIQEVKVEKVKVESKPVKKATKEVAVEVDDAIEEPETPTKQDEEPIDWLAKFREAAQKYREEAAQASQAPKAPVHEEVASSTMSMADAVKISEEPAFAEEEEPVIKKARQETKNFYRSNLGGLKEIAQNIDKGSRNSFLDYAFTLNAGLSLFKPIKPFSILHAYVKSEDLSFFEKLLGLSPADETNAQLCLILSNDDSIYKNREEMHGLYVVEKKRLLQDVQQFGDSALVSEASSVLK